MKMTAAIIVAILLLIVPLALLIAGQQQLLSGRRPTDLGVTNRMLKPPDTGKQNSLSSQASIDNSDHAIAPLAFTGDGHAAFRKLTAIVTGMRGARVITARPDYLYAEYETRWLRFVDDVEFLLDEPAGVIHMRSASRMGRKDFGVNRTRLESIRSQFSRP